jgi:hypothetical protein
MRPTTPWTGESFNKEPEPEGLTQKEKMLLAFRAYGVVCGNTFLTMHIPRYAARVSDLKADGYKITRAKCPYSHHSHGKQIATYEMDLGYKGQPIW